MKGVDRYWFLTWTTYGQWLPGDERGSVTRIRTPHHEHRIEEDRFGTPRTEGIPELHASAQKSLACDPIVLNQSKADELLSQFHETCQYRNWLLIAVSIMGNHIHALLGVPGDPDPEDLLRDLKAYGSRRLNRLYGKPKSETWWTASGSCRRKSDPSEIHNAVEYVRTQKHALVIWINPQTDGWE